MAYENDIPKLFSTNVLKDLVEKFGTPDGVRRSWDTRGRTGKKEDENVNATSGKLKVCNTACQSVLEHTKKNGGGTFKFDASGEPIPLKEGIAVAEDESRGVVVTSKASKKEDIDDYIKENFDELSRPGKYLGTWDNPEDGKMYFDITTVYPEAQLEHAKASGAAHHQIAVYNIRTGETIPVGGSGAVSGDHDKTVKKTYGSIGALGFYASKA
jgi:hypothetical protein